jgi:VanZ family protein
LGVFQRADWIANALVVMPSAFLLAGGIDYGRPSRVAYFAIAPILICLLMGIVFAIELTQVWFPPRTVSQNDIVAGCLGAVLGVIVWGLLGRVLVGSIESFSNLPSIEHRIRWLALMACFGCIVYSVYPFDVIMSRQEWLEKQSQGRIRWEWGWGNLGLATWLKGIVVSFARMVPFALFLGLKKPGHASLAYLSTIALLLELVQLPIFSKSFSTVELVASLTGAWFSYMAVVTYPLWLKWFKHPLWWALASFVCSVGIFTAFNLRFDRILFEDTELKQRWKDFFLPPLIRYYYTSEYSALSNLAGKILLFSILGFLVRLWEYFMLERSSFAEPRYSSVFRWGGLIWAAGLATAIEVCQLYLPPLIADATDIVVYVSGYAAAYFGTALIIRPSHPKMSVDRG